MPARVLVVALWWAVAGHGEVAMVPDGGVIDGSTYGLVGLDVPAVLADELVLGRRAHGLPAVGVLVCIIHAGPFALTT